MRIHLGLFAFIGPPLSKRTGYHPESFWKALLFIWLAVATSAQATEFQRVVGGPQMDRGVYVSPTEDGGYVVVGVTKSEGKGDEDIYLVKFDSTGETLWRKTYGGTEVDNGWCVFEVDGGFIIAGSTNSLGAGGFDCYLLAVDSSGELKWERTYGGESDDHCWNVIPTSDGGYAMVGETWSSGAGAEDFLLIKTDADGKEEWSRTFGGGKGDRAFSIEEADDGGFVLVGQTYSEGAGERDVYIVKTDMKGKQQWAQVFGGAGRDVGHGVDKTAEGDFLVTGYTNSFAETGYDPYLILINPHGETVWTRVLNIAGENRTITGEQGPDGAFYLTGCTHNPADKSTAALLVRADVDGHLDWTRTLLGTKTGQSFGYTIRATPDGGCVVTGHTTEGSAGDLDLFIIKIGADGAPNE